MLSQATIQEAITRLAEAAQPTKIILFGSYARGEARDSSDLDFLVIQREVKSRRREMVRLHDVLRPMRIPVDVLVISEALFAEWADTPGTVLYRAQHEGRLVYEVS